ncbi:hypothetical protein [Pseudoflavonifractor sp. MCC625]|uniref:hypothetical protein n=1 Tax=Pseudoflavonifractor sp. MCC625 TaxID=2592647 RepID=UPI001C010F74|nr:hypothetical protein [Pseudoflavonifractor sp. MCC625]
MGKTWQELEQQLADTRAGIAAAQGAEDAWKEARSRHEALEQESRRAWDYVLLLSGQLEELEGWGPSGLHARLTRQGREARAECRTLLERERANYEEKRRVQEEAREEMERLAGPAEERTRLERRYEELLREKADLLREDPGELGERLRTLERERNALYNLERELSRALSAAQSARASIRRMSGSLDHARNWGTVDLLGGGLLSTMAKHDHLDDAQHAAQSARYALERLRSQMTALQKAVHVPQVELSSFAVFADYWMDGLFADWYVQSRIKEAQAGTTQALSNLGGLISALGNQQRKAAGRLRSAEGARRLFLEEPLPGTQTE